MTETRHLAGSFEAGCAKSKQIEIQNKVIRFYNQNHNILSSIFNDIKKTKKTKNITKQIVLMLARKVLVVENYKIPTFGNVKA